MPLFDSIFGQGIAAVKGIIEEFHLSPEDKAKLEAAAGQLQFNREQLASNEKIELAKVEAALTTSQSSDQTKIITTDSSSSDPFVRRARPTFLYIMEGAIGFSLIIVPLVNAITGKGLVPMNIPGDYLQLFGVSLLALTGSRTWEKLKDKD